MHKLPADIATYWKTVLDTVQEALLILSPSGEIISMNRAAEEITGYRADEIIGQNCTILDCDGCKLYARGPGKDWCKLFEDGQVVSKKCHITTKAGEKLTVLKRATVLEDASGQTLGAVETLNNITEMMQKENEIVSLRRSLAREEGFHGMIGHSPVMQRLYELIENIAQSEAPVLIMGESGTGKELVARAVHRLSLRSDKPFIKVNCAALNQNLLETELFGHVKGAFTGADRNRTGRFEAAHTGDIFLDEIGDVPLPTQVKLLRVLQEKEIERVGDHKPISVDVRFVTATNRDLAQLMARGEFREDLFYRINVVPISLPALRERSEDIPILAQGFMDRICLSG
jgi:two-component system response regulator HydG